MIKTDLLTMTLGEKAILIGFLLFCWAMAPFFARLLYAIFPAYWEFIKRRQLGKWQGKHYAFRNFQVRFCLDSANTVWIVEDDIFRMLRPAPARLELKAVEDQRGVIPGHKEQGITLAGLDRLLTQRTNHRRTEHEMILLRRWLHNEVVPNLLRQPLSSM